MKVVLYKSNSSKDKIVKSLATPSDFDGFLRGECSILNPVLEIAASSVVSYNYCYIPDFGRYYFINDAVSVRNGIWRLSLHVDVLMSYANEILSSDVVINKSASSGRSNLYFDDGSIKSEASNIVDVKNFSGGFNDSDTYILITTG